MEKSESIKSIAAAMCKAQGEMGGALKGANNPFFKSKYADLGEVIKVVKEPFANNGLSFVQFPINDGDKVGVDLNYLAARRKEIQFCLAQLAEKIGAINIASAKGVGEFDMANGLVKWYWTALCKVNNKHKLLTGAYPEVTLTNVQREARESRMGKEFKERTI